MKAHGLIGIQERYTERVLAAKHRWAHARTGGHFGRSRSAAYKEARAALLALGFTKQQADTAIRDANDMVDLIWHAEEE